MTDRKISFLLAGTSALALSILTGTGLGTQTAHAQGCVGNNGVSAPDGGWDGTDNADVITCTPGKLSGGDVHGMDGADTIATKGAILDVINAGSGADTVGIIGGQTTEVLGGSGNDAISLLDGAVLTKIDGENGDDVIFVDDGQVPLIEGGLGNDTITLDNAVVDTVMGDDTSDGVHGNDLIRIFGGTVGSVDGQGGDDTIRLDEEALVQLSISGGDGRDFIDLRSGTVSGQVLGGIGQDTIRMSGGYVDGSIGGESGADVIILNSGHIGGAVNGGIGDDDILIRDGVVGSSVLGGGGADDIAISGGVISGNVVGGGDADDIVIIGGEIGDDVDGGSGNDDIEIYGGVIGDDVLGSAGEDEIVLFGGVIGADVSGGSDNDEIIIIDATIGGNVHAGTGKDFVVLGGGTIGGSAFGGGGDDLVVVGEAFDFGNLGNGSGNLAGDRNNGIDVGNDTLAFVDWQGEVGADRIREFNEIYVVEEATLRLNGGTLMTSKGGPDLNLYVGQQSALEIENDVTVQGRLENRGLIDLSANSHLDDRLEVTGNYVGDGALNMDAHLNDATDDVIADRLDVGGSTSGTTVVTVTNQGGLGGLTGSGADDGILLVSVGGGSYGDFVLSDELLAGVYEYDLVQADGQNWYLQSDFLDQVFVYESLPGALQTIGSAAVGTLADRVGVGAGAAGSGDGSILAGVWLRGVGQSLESDGDLNSTTGGSFEQTTGVAQGGADFEVWRGSGGRLLAGVVGHAGTSSLDVADVDGDARGSANADVYGGGITATWFGAGGFYLDSVFQYNVYDIDMSTASRFQSAGTTGSGMAASGEAGWRFALSDTFSVVPQAQLTWQTVDVDEFTDPDGRSVNLSNGDSLEGRLGAAVEATFAAGSTPIALYGEANLHHDFLGENEVIVSAAAGDTPINQTLRNTSASLGMGGTVGISEGLALYAEVDYRVPFDGGIQGVQASGGLRLSW
ncbi:MAG: autotransporter outer membrane beta-barrel domain-containing protein [Pseudomonadota bacterium]